MDPGELPLPLPLPPSTTPQVLVLLAAYNGATWIREQIQSILQQAGVHVRLIVRDDGSEDSTVAVVRELAAADKRIELLPCDAPSGSASQNFFSLIRSCDATAYEFVALSDQDDLWHPDKLHQGIQFVTESRATGCSSAVTAVWPAGTSRLLRQNRDITESDYLFEGAGQGCTFVLSASLYAQVRCFLATHEPLTQDIHFHDWAIYALARTWRLKWAFYPHSTMTYRQHSGNDIGARSSLRGVVMRLARIREGWYLRQLLRISDLCQAAAGNDPIISRWYAVLRAPKDWNRRLTIVRFCLRGGRRKSSDNVILIIAALAGWI